MDVGDDERLGGAHIGGEYAGVGTSGAEGWYGAAAPTPRVISMGWFGEF